MKEILYYLHTISGLHVGTGQGIGVIDMPIARERASHLPIVPGSGIKGVLRDECQPDENASDEDKQDYLALFGPKAGEDASAFAGSISVGDARLLCLPIRSWKGTFAWTTCPMILQRYKRDLEDNGETGVPSAKIELAENQAKHANNTKLKEGGKVFLEDLDLIISEDTTTEAEEWAIFIANKIFKDRNEWKDTFRKRFLILPDNIFDFLSETATEIRARIKIESDTRTVKGGALWYEEYLPAETLLWGVLATDRARNESKKSPEDLLAMLPINNQRLQIGGNATVGAGQVRWITGVE